MNDSEFQQQAVPFPCPECGNEIEVTLGDPTFHENVVCGTCGLRMDVDTKQLQSVLKDIDNSLSDIGVDVDINIE